MHHPARLKHPALPLDSPDLLAPICTHPRPVPRRTRPLSFPPHTLVTQRHNLIECPRSQQAHDTVPAHEYRDQRDDISKESVGPVAEEPERCRNEVDQERFEH